MDDTKAISPEVRGLFETIKSQAKEYEKAYKYLEIEKLKLEQQRKDLEHLMDDLRNEVSYTTLKLNQKVQESLTFIENRTEKTIKIYDNLENIVDLRDSLSQLQILVKKQVSEVENFLKTEIPKTLKEFDSLLKNVKTRSETELESILNSFRQKMEKYLEVETLKLEQKSSAKFKQVDIKIQSFEQKINSISDSQSEEVRKLKNEIFELRNKVSNYNSLNDNVYNSLELSINDIREKISKKINDLSANVYEIENWKKNQALTREKDKTILENFDFLISSLSAKVAKIEETKNNISTKVNSSLVISIISSIGFAVLLLYVLGII